MPEPDESLHAERSNRFQAVSAGADIEENRLGATGRRGFLRWIIRAVNMFLTAILGVPIVANLADSRHRSAGQRDFRRVARLSEVLQKGKIASNTGKRIYEALVRDTRRDAWTVYPNEVLGRIWLVLDPKEKLNPAHPDSALVAFTSICPHLGCAIGYQSQTEEFVCPCHAGVFDLAGQVLKGPPPRPMDRLQVRLVPDPSGKGDYFIEVRYQEFLPDQSESIPKA